MTISPFEAYRMYVALKRHFEPGSTYDFIRFNGQTNVSQKSFEGRKDNIFFQKLAKHPDVLGLLVANLSHDSKMWIGSIPYNPEAIKRYEDRAKRLQSLAYTVAGQLPSGTPSDFNGILRCHPNEHPQLLKLYLSGKVYLETMIVVDDLTNFSKSWKNTLKGDPVCSEVLEKIQKTRPFLTYDKEMVRTAVMKKYS